MGRMSLKRQHLDRSGKIESTNHRQIEFESAVRQAFLNNFFLAAKCACGSVPSGRTRMPRNEPPREYESMAQGIPLRPSSQIVIIRDHCAAIRPQPSSDSAGKVQPVKAAADRGNDNLFVEGTWR